jgi:hypothetical protein
MEIRGVFISTLNPGPFCPLLPHLDSPDWNRRVLRSDLDIVDVQSFLLYDLFASESPCVKD